MHSCLRSSWPLARVTRPAPGTTPNDSHPASAGKLRLVAGTPELVGSDPAEEEIVKLLSVSQFSLQFGEPLNEAVSDPAIVVKDTDEDPVNGSITWAADRRSLVFTPGSPSGHPSPTVADSPAYVCPCEYTRA